MPNRQLMETMTTSAKFIESLPGRQLMEAINATARVQTINLDWLQLQHNSVSASTKPFVYKEQCYY